MVGGLLADLPGYDSRGGSQNEIATATATATC